MVAIAKIKPGDVLYDVRRQKMGNTVMSRTAVWPVRIDSVDQESCTAIVRWNWNAPQKYYASDLRRLVRTPPKGTHERERLDAERAKSEAEK